MIEEPGFARLFSTDALVETAFSAVVGGQVVAGSVDRLLVEDERVLVVDYKTARHPPANAAEVPEGTALQMAAYVAALSQIYPGRSVRAALLYTQGPSLIEMDAERLSQLTEQFG